MEARGEVCNVGMVDGDPPSSGGGWRCGGGSPASPGSITVRRTWSYWLTNDSPRAIIMAFPGLPLGMPGVYLRAKVVGRSQRHPE
jgi:hypothetical protein